MPVIFNRIARSTMLISSERKIEADKKFEFQSTVTGEFKNHLFQRLGAKKVTFDRVDFSFTFFDTCYLRDCVFQNCNFTGCRFTACNFYGSRFDGCKFDYAFFERTILDPEILDVGCPGWDNLKLKFARSLRMNFQQIGNVDGVNRAIMVELDATRVFLEKAWRSNEAYYRNKYKGWSHIGKFFQWFGFVLGDLIWGNGEQLWKLLRAVVVGLVVIAAADVFMGAADVGLVRTYWDAFLRAPAILFGVTSPSHYPSLYVTGILAARLVVTAFFLSIIIKRFSRR